MRYYIVGHIAILNVSEDPKSDAEEILRRHKNVRTVLLKVGELSGEYRVGRYVIIAGENNTETVHIEHGLRFMVDPTKAYFNPALESERSRIISFVSDGDVVFDMFAGVGTLSIRIAAAKEATVYAVEKNRSAYEYLLRNIELNKKRLRGRIIAIHADVSDVVYRYRSIADHTVMDLPRYARWFLPDAAVVAKDGSYLHYYRIVERRNLDQPKIEIRQVFPRVSFEDFRIVRGVSPSKVLTRTTAKVYFF